MPIKRDIRPKGAGDSLQARARAVSSADAHYHRQRNADEHHRHHPGDLSAQVVHVPRASEAQIDSGQHQQRYGSRAPPGQRPERMGPGTPAPHQPGHHDGECEHDDPCIDTSGECRRRDEAGHRQTHGPLRPGLHRIDGQHGTSRAQEEQQGFGQRGPHGVDPGKVNRQSGHDHHREPVGHHPQRQPEQGRQSQAPDQRWHRIGTGSPTDPPAHGQQRRKQVSSLDLEPARSIGLGLTTAGHDHAIDGQHVVAHPAVDLEVSVVSDPRSPHHVDPGVPIRDDVLALMTDVVDGGRQYHSEAEPPAPTAGLVRARAMVPPGLAIPSTARTPGTVQ